MYRVHFSNVPVFESMNNLAVNRISEIDKELKGLEIQAKTATPAYLELLRVGYKLKLMEKQKLLKEGEK